MAVVKLGKLESDSLSGYEGVNGQGVFAPSKSKRQAFFLNQSKSISSIRAVKEAKLIKNLKPSDVKIIKICG